MTRLVAAELDKINIRYEYLHGGVPSEKRKDLMENFTSLPESRVFISTDAGSTGLNLQAASILINLDLPWNPAVLEQRIARIYRIGQQRNIQVINLVAPSSIEERMLSTLNFKTSLFEGILDNGEDSIFLDDSKLDKIMENIASVVTESPNEEKKESGDIIDPEDREKPASLPEKDEKPAENIQADTFDEESLSQTEYTRASETPEADRLISQGVSFFNGLVQTLKSPEATRRLAKSLIEENKETGKTTLRIPVPDKESVINFLTLAGSILAHIGEKK